GSGAVGPGGSRRPARAPTKENKLRSARLYLTLHGVQEFNRVVDLLSAQSSDNPGRSTVGNVSDVDAGRLVEQFARKMLCRAEAYARQIELTGRSLGQRHKPFDIIGCKIFACTDNECTIGDKRHMRK